MAASGSTKAVLAALIANAGIAVGKFVGFAITGASSMLAEALHSVADSGNQALLLLGVRQARQEATSAHPFGYGRARYFWSFVVAIVLFSLGSLFSLFEGIHKRAHPEPLSAPAVALVILGVGIVLEIWSFRTAIIESNRHRGDQSWWRFIRHGKIPELIVVVLEDAGALFGLVLAFAGISLAAVTGNPLWDAYGTIAIGVLLGVIAAVLIVEMHGLLIGEAAGPEDIAAIRAALTAAPEIERILHLRTQHLGPETLLVGAKVELPDGMAFAEVVQAINAAEARVRAALPSARYLYLEPDLSSGQPGAPASDGAAI